MERVKQEVKTVTDATPIKSVNGSSGTVASLLLGHVTPFGWICYPELASQIFSMQIPPEVLFSV